MVGKSHPLQPRYPDSKDPLKTHVEWAWPKGICVHCKQEKPVNKVGTCLDCLRSALKPR